MSGIAGEHEPIARAVPAVPGDGAPARQLLEALAAAIVRVAAADSLDDLAVAATGAAASLCGSAGAAVVLWNDADRAVAAAIDGRRWGFPDVLDRAIRAASDPGDGAEPVLRLGGFDGAASRRVATRARLIAPSGDRGVVVLLDDLDVAGPDPARSALLVPLAAAIGSAAEQISARLSQAAASVDPAHGLLVRDARAERRRIARELHDGLIQSLYGTGLAIRARAVRTDIPARGRETMLQWVDRIDRLIDEARGYVDELERADDAVAELGAGLDEIAEAAATAGLEVSTEISATEQVRPTPDVRREILRVAHEAMSNAVRHSSARRVAIRIDMDPAADIAQLTVEDDGVGFDPGAGLPAGRGIRNMMARAATLGGELDVVSRPGAGTKVRLRVRLTSRGPLEVTDA